MSNRKLRLFVLTRYSFRCRTKYYALFSALPTLVVSLKQETNVKVLPGTRVPGSSTGIRVSVCRNPVVKTALPGGQASSKIWRVPVRARYLEDPTSTPDQSATRQNRNGKKKARDLSGIYRGLKKKFDPWGTGRVSSWYFSPNSLLHGLQLVVVFQAKHVAM